MPLSQPCSAVSLIFQLSAQLQGRTISSSIFFHSLLEIVWINSTQCVPHIDIDILISLFSALF